MIPCYLTEIGLVTYKYYAFSHISPMQGRMTYIPLRDWNGNIIGSIYYHSGTLSDSQLMLYANID